MRLTTPNASAIPLLLALALSPGAAPARAQTRLLNPVDKFKQLEEILPTPNHERTASGSPGKAYWQQRADYVIDVELDEARRRIVGRETVTYKNNSPDTLVYLWIQLDQNLFRKDSDTRLTQTAPRLPLPPPPPAGAPMPGAVRPMPRLTFEGLDTLLTSLAFDGGHHITSVTNAGGAPVPHTIVKTMMRIDLPQPLPPQASVVLNIAWAYNIHDGKTMPVRGGYESFKDGNDIFAISQWYPRLAAYTDVNGWQHKQYLGAGEFTLEFGDFLVRITAPEDHVVAASGVLQNPDQVLSKTQRDRLAEARSAKKPVMVVTAAEARENEKDRSTARKTWVFKADNVRDFAFASSRKFIWDAQAHSMGGGRDILAMSYYPNEGNPLWEQYSTAAILHTLNVYSRYTFAYPYPVASSVFGPEGSMEYPMLSFNTPRPEDDGTYTQRRKYSLISTIIHEVGHNFFPMIVNSDERQWGWMDEGVNSFIQYLAEVEWEKGYPSTRGLPTSIVDYMTSEAQDPIMTSADNVQQIGPNAYNKTATGLNILRETVLGRDLFDFAFRQYAQRWKFKRPEPADFFRTMEDASGIDLDWFWRGWFYGTDSVDQAIDGVKLFNLDTRNPEVEKPLQRREREAKAPTLSENRNAPLPRLVDANPELKDFYNRYDPTDITAGDRQAYADLLARLDPRDREILATLSNFYVVGIRNRGGLVMPVILKIDYSDGSSEELRIPAEIWRKNSVAVEKLIVTPKEIARLTLDPHAELPDSDLSNNIWPPQPARSRLQLFKEEKFRNPMQEVVKPKN